MEGKPQMGRKFLEFKTKITEEKRKKDDFGSLAGSQK